MPGATQLDRVTMVVLRYLRRPLFALVLVYAVGIIGMALIPGQDGRPMSLFHAFYFFTYTATTTGFGEIPLTFTDEQRLWAIFCLYTGVIAWFYALGSVLHLVQNPHFVNALNEYRFARQTRYIRDPFFILCGFGDTGSLLARGLSDHHLGAVVIDADPERIKALALRNYTVRMPGLCADASVPKHLVDAGVRQPNCRGVIALTGDDETNRKVAVVTRFLNPDVRVILRSTSSRHEEHLRSLYDVTVIDPFEIFAQLVCMAIATPWVHNLNSWLVGVQGVRLGRPLEVPPGDWILCGYGRMGRWLDRYMSDQGLHVTCIDPELEGPEERGERFIRSHADQDALARAGITAAAGIVAGTNRDSDNLGVLMSARQSNPDIFCIARQNSHDNQPAFDAARADLTLQHSLTTARRVLKHLISPLAQELIDHLRARDPVETRQLIDRLQAALGEAPPAPVAGSRWARRRPRRWPGAARAAPRRACASCCATRVTGAGRWPACRSACAVATTPWCSPTARPRSSPATSSCCAVPRQASTCCARRSTTPTRSSTCSPASTRRVAGSSPGSSAASAGASPGRWSTEQPIGASRLRAAVGTTQARPRRQARAFAARKRAYGRTHGTPARKRAYGRAHGTDPRNALRHDSAGPT
ncbi:MAG: NAD(P)-binding protein [Halofilum sp. (in: g-proteobacteria)]|nr:NAD(P)-binding protein [Halofilum sp. (in: g-proteobacteria)]